MLIDRKATKILGVLDRQHECIPVPVPDIIKQRIEMTNEAITVPWVPNVSTTPSDSDQTGQFVVGVSVGKQTEDEPDEVKSSEEPVSEPYDFYTIGIYRIL